MRGILLIKHQRLWHNKEAIILGGKITLRVQIRITPFIVVFLCIVQHYWMRNICCAFLFNQINITNGWFKGDRWGCYHSRHLMYHRPLVTGTVSVEALIWWTKCFLKILIEFDTPLCRSWFYFEDNTPNRKSFVTDWVFRTLCGAPVRTRTREKPTPG